MTAPCCPAPEMALGRDEDAHERACKGPVKSAVYAVEGMHCAGCIRAVELALEAVPGITHARVNYTLRRVSVEGHGAAVEPPAVEAAVKAAGYRATPFEAGLADAAADREMKRLMLALAVAGFAAMNIMLLSVSVWAGNASDITPETRDLFHWISALIALPAAAIAGRTFYESAFRALAAKRLNMDVPITLGVVLALGLSVYQTAISAEEAYFESAIMLLFFLLAGRALEQAVRRKTRTLAGNIAAFRTGSVERVTETGAIETIAPALLETGDRVLVRPGDRLPVDGVVVEGRSEADASMITGETTPRSIAPGDTLYAGTLNLGGSLTVEVRSMVGDTLIDEVQHLLDKATEARSRRLDLADRAARLYAPVVHGTAALAAAGWLLYGAGIHHAVVVATTVLIITCPCALALAIPAVQVAAAGALFRKGVFLNAGTAIERLADVDTVVFDKTGTLTLPELDVANLADIPADLAEDAARLALASRHPLAAALATHAEGLAPFGGAEEIAGQGVRAMADGVEMRLGSPDFCNVAAPEAGDGAASLIAFRKGERTAVFRLAQELRPDARATIDRLKEAGLEVIILSGDHAPAVAAAARALGVAAFEAGLKPADKIARIEALAAEGRTVAMAGDGLNDAPALAAAHVSISPATAVDMTRTHADAVFLGRNLAPVADAIAISRRARRLMTQNLAFAGLYNMVAIPLAVLGLVTPLIAAVSMSGSSLVVTANAMRALPRQKAAKDESALPAFAREAAA